MPVVWRGGYALNLESAQGIKTVRVELDEVRSTECPRSIAIREDYRSDDLIQIVAQAEAVGGGLGPVEKLPGWMYDSLKIIKDHTAIDASARERAIAKA